MRRKSFLATLVLAVVLVFAAAGCGSASSTDSAAASPQTKAKAILEASEQLKSAVYDIQAEVTLQIDPTQLPAEDLQSANMFKNGVTLAGTISADGEHGLVDADLTISTAGISYNLGLKMVDDSIWFKIMGQWYDITPALQEAIASNPGIQQSYDYDAMRETISEAGVALESWLGDITLGDTETIDGTETYHLSSKPDLTKIVSDVSVLLQDKDFLALLDPTGSLVDSLGLDEDMPTTADLEEFRDIADDAFSVLTLDLWAGQRDDLLRRVEFHTTFLPPAEAEMTGITSMALAVTVNLTGVNKPVTVKAPEDALPYTQFQQMFGSDLPGVFPSDPGADEPVDL